MMEVRLATIADAEIISKLANKIWPVTYNGIISEEQIAFMLEQSYTVSAVENQIKNGQLFFILESGSVAQGFASLTKEDEEIYKLQKLYIHQNLHGQGAGRFLITAVENYCREQGATQLLLNVNRNNRAKFFYEKMGYQVIDVVDIPYFGYVLDDYVMAKSLV